MGWIVDLWRALIHPQLTGTAPATGVKPPRTLRGARYPWTVQVVGDDLVVTNQIATWFGGQRDKDSGQDSGETASGLNTIASPNYMGCALPLDFHRPHDNPCAGSPLPRIPWYTLIEVTNLANKRSVYVRLIDLGPDAPPAAHGAIDLTQPAFLSLGGNIDAGELRVDFRIIGGAKYVG